MSVLTRTCRNLLTKCSSKRNYSEASQTGESKSTHFGFQQVTEEEKVKKVHGVFENVANKYDVMNDLMSGGIHRVWKDYFIEKLHPLPQAKLLDVAGGTGDISFRYIKRLLYDQKINKLSTDSSHPSEQVTICDLSESMLAEGEKKAAGLGYHGIQWTCGNAQKLPFPDNNFDCYTIAFGIRNVADIPQALDEAYRVLKPGGRFMCLEFSHVNNPALKWIYDQYSFNIIPPMGHVVAGDWDSYQYLVESIRQFPNQKDFCAMIEAAGFRNVRHEDLTFGVTAIHSGFKL